MVFLLFCVWVGLAFVVASGAKKRNRSYGGYLFLSLLLSPVIGGIVLMMLGDKV